MKQIYILTTILLLAISNLNAQQAESLNFDGMDDKIDLGAGITAALTGSNSFTVEALVYNTVITGTAIIVGNHGAGGNTQFALRRIEGEYQLMLGFGTHSVTTTTSPALLNTWQHIAVVKDNNDLHLYINGVLVISTVIPSYTLLSSMDNVVMGHNDFNEAFTGTMDEVRIWNTARSVSEISSNYNNELTLPQANLTAYYKFNQGVANANNAMETILNDELGVNNGVLSNFALNGTTSNWIADSTLSINNVSIAGKGTRLYPNPSNDFFQVSGLEKSQAYKISNILGSEVKSGTISNNNRVDILNLTKGIYFLTFENGNTIKFIKE